MKKYLLIAALIAGSTLTSEATPILPGPETPLQSILDSNVSGTSINVNTDQVINDSYWTAGVNPAAYLVIEIAGYAGDNAFGIYQNGDPANKQQVFAGSASGPSGPVTIAVPWSSFGFYLENTNVGFTWYSDPTLNGGGDHFVTFEGATGATLSGAAFGVNDYVLGIEDLNLGDQDYNDMVVLVQNVNTVPDGGSTIALLGLGLCGFSFLRRRFVAGK